jgi:putative DNA primase/helicase
MVGRPAPAPADERTKLESALAYVNPDLGYDDWLQVGMALYAELGSAGLAVWDYWSGRGQKYQGRKSLDTHWRSFERGGVNTVTGAKIYRLATDAGWRAPRKPPLHSCRAAKPPTPSERSAKGEEGKGEAKKERPPTFWEQIGRLRDRYTLIYGTDTVYDHQEHDIIRVANLRLAFGKDPVNMWLYSDGRRMVTRDHVVFDPTDKAQLPDYVNLFHGMPMQPDGSKSCARILELLYHLCNEEDAIYEWVLKWIAFPLQRPGAKMETAIVMHSEEGSGKNLFWEAVKSLYGIYASVITQNELESQFNTWASRKLFMIANEVVSRSELREHKGRLKNYITESELQINEKLLPSAHGRESHELCFSLQRNAAARAGSHRSPVPGAVDAAGASSGFLCLREGRDIERRSRRVVCTAPRDRSRATSTSTPSRSSRRPSATSSRSRNRRPSSFSINGARACCSVPYHSAAALDLYRAFVKWCGINGEKHPPSQTKFGGAIRRLGVRSAIKRLRMPGRAERQATVYEVRVPDDSEWHGEALEKLVEDFSQQLELWQRGDVNG